MSHRESCAIACRGCNAIARPHVQIFPLRRNRGIITKSDRPKGVQCDRLSPCSNFSLEKEPGDNHQERSPKGSAMRSPFSMFKFFP
ncbi:hypothetical protein FHL01_00435 [Cylindrospermopsis raciborskii CS-506_C]|nr:hypothetical protein [Cylindrospermopsis raciborskii CS-506_C]